MKRVILMVPLAMLWVLTIAVPDAGAFETYSSGMIGNERVGYCADCHGDFFRATYTSNKDGTPWGSTLMQGHNSFLGSDCDACHVGTSRSPVEIGRSDGGTGFDPVSCLGCHGRPADAQGPSACVFTINIDPANCGTGAGLRQHHTNAGVTACAGCHVDANPGAFTTAAESAMPAYYFTPDTAHPTKPADACNALPAPGNENKFGPTGLDNDGDLLDDGADPDCVANAPPVANANGPYTGTVGIAVAFDGTGSSDSDGTIVSYEWDFGDGNTDTGSTPTHTYASDGIFDVTLTVTDDGGLTDSDTTTATISIGNQAPTADANGPYTGTVGSPVQFDGTGSSDPDGTIVSYEWDFGDGNTGTGVNPTHTYASDGTFSVMLTVTDDGGLTDTDSTTATIGPVPNVPPTADANGPYGGTAGSPVQFDGSGSNDPDGTIVVYDWDFGDGNTGTGVNPTHTYASDGTFNVTLTVTDDDGATGTDTTTATIGAVQNEAPVADPNGPYSGEIGVPVAFDGTASNDPDGTIVAYDWDFGDGGVGSGPTPSHTYASDGTFTVTLMVTDDGGLSDSATTTATITTAGPIPPTADANGPYVGTVGVPVQFDGSGSSDPNGTIVSYDWDFGDGNSGTGVSPSHTYAAPGLYSVSLTVTDDEGATDTDGTTANISAVGPMEVDLKVPRAINPGNNGVTPVGFWVDLMDLEIAEVACGPGMAEPKRLHPGDFNDDGFRDVGALFRTGELGIVCGDETLMCQGTLADGTPFTATSNVFKTVGKDCRPPKPQARRGR